MKRAGAFLLATAPRQAGAAAVERRIDVPSFVIGERVELAGLPPTALVEEAYVLRVTPTGVTGRATSPAGLLHAAQTLRQLLRIFAADGTAPLPDDRGLPDFSDARHLHRRRPGTVRADRGQRLSDRSRSGDCAEFKMNTLVIECYNLFPYASFPACADEGTLSEEDCREIVAESKRYHVTIVPSLQTLAQA